MQLGKGRITVWRTVVNFDVVNPGDNTGRGRDSAIIERQFQDLCQAILLESGARECVVSSWARNRKSDPSRQASVDG